MELFQVWTMPEDKVNGSHDKWQTSEPIKAKCRKAVVGSIQNGIRKGASDLIGNKKEGAWKVRKV